MSQVPLADRPRMIQTALMGWITALGADFLLHGGLLAGLYAEPSPFLLPPERAFQLIPLGYLSFLLLTILVLWLLVRLGIAGFARGALFGLKFGALTWGALLLGMLSITTANPRLLLAWWVGQSLQAALAAGVMASAPQFERLRVPWLRVLIFVVFAIATTIVLQNIGLPSFRGQG